jgi:hypothetical protein
LLVWEEPSLLLLFTAKIEERRCTFGW